MKVTDILVEHFPQRDGPEVHPRTWRRSWIRSRRRNSSATKCSDEFYGPFAEDLKTAEDEMLAEAPKCPQCGKPLVERFSKFGKFFGCSGHPECKYIKREERRRQTREAAAPTGIKCPHLRQADGQAHRASAGRFWVAAAIPIARRR